MKVICKIESLEQKDQWVGIKLEKWWVMRGGLHAVIGKTPSGALLRQHVISKTRPDEAKAIEMRQQLEIQLFDAAVELEGELGRCIGAMQRANPNLR